MQGSIPHRNQGDNFSGCFSISNAWTSRQILYWENTNYSLFCLFEKLWNRIYELHPVMLKIFQTITCRRHFPSPVSSNKVLQILTHGGAAVCDKTAQPEFSVLFGKHPASCYHQVAFTKWLLVALNSTMLRFWFFHHQKT
jgi:hypothetical protein